MRRLAVTAGLAAVVAVHVPGHAQSPAAQEVLLEVKRFEVVGDNPLSPGDTEAVLARYLGPHASLTTLETAAESLENRMRERGFSFHRVIVPAQKPAGGVVRLEVLHFALDSVAVTGNEHFSRDNILRSVPALTPGPSPDVGEIARELALANEHPSKRLTVVLKESDKSDALDAEVRVRDLPRAQVFLSLIGNTQDRYNVINENTGYTRLTLGFQNSNLFDRDHSVTFAYTTSPDHIDKVQQFGAFYSIPFYGYHASLQGYYLRSDVNSGTVGIGAQSANVSGRGEFAGLRLSYALAKWGEMTQQVSVAVDDKHFAGNVDVFGTFLPNTDTHSRPLSLRYAVRTEQPWGGAGAYGEIVANLFGGSSNSLAAYAAARPGASNEWKAVRYGADVSYGLSRWTLSGRLRAQYTGGQLIPGEQFGLGGVASIRGLREREFTGDSGYTLTLEALGPPLVDTLKPVVFLDRGYAALRGAAGVPGLVTTTENASSVGAGVRWSWNRQLEASADLAYVLNGTVGTLTVPGTDSGHMRLNFAVFYRF